MKKRGAFFSMDALIALSIIIIVLTVAFPIVKSSQKRSEIQGDLIRVLTTLKIGEINNATVTQWINDGDVTDGSKTIIEQIGIFISQGDREKAVELANITLNQLKTKEKIGIWYDNKCVAAKNNNTPFSLAAAKNIDVERHVISGISDKGITGYSARAFLSALNRTKHFYFGGYVGEGDLTLRVDFNGTIQSAEIVHTIPYNFKVSINPPVNPGKMISCSAAVNDFTPSTCTIPNNRLDQFGKSVDYVKLHSATEKLHIAGGYLKIIYDPLDEYEQPKKYYFPGIEGFLNVYDGFYIPGQINKMNASIRFNSSLDIFLAIGNKTFELGNTTDITTKAVGLVTKKITDAAFDAQINYSKISRTTVPVRLGIKNASSLITQVEADIDVVSVNDLSGSMGSATDYNSKMSESIRATKRLIDVMLNDTNPAIGNNRVGVNGYGSYVSNTEYHELSDDKTSLKAEVSPWRDVGRTNICSGVNRAVWEFVQPKSTGLVAYYDFDDNTTDDKGPLGNDGIFKGTEEYSADLVDVIEGNSLKMSGDDYIVADFFTKYITKNGDISNNDFSVSLWAKSDAGSDKDTLFAFYQDHIKMWDENSDEFYDIRAMIRDVTNNLNLKTDNKYYDTAISIRDSNWHHIVMTYDFDARFIKMYIDDVDVYTHNLTGRTSDIDGPAGFTVVSPDTNFTIGQDYDDDFDYTPTDFFEGFIDEVRLYDKTLTPAEISGLYDQSAGGDNGIVEVGEVCDGDRVTCYDALENEGYHSCTAAGTFNACYFSETCGDDYKNSTEECDDGNIINGDGCSSTCESEGRDKFMVVMTDGSATQPCAEMGYVPDIAGINFPADYAVAAACRAYQKYGIKVYTVAFNAPASAKITLEQMVEPTCGNGIDYIGNVGGLEALYAQIANDIMNATYRKQTLEIVGQFYSYLDPDSYIEFDYLRDRNAGLVVTQNWPFNDTRHGNFTVPKDFKILDAKVISYSGPFWTNEVFIRDNGNPYETAYDLGEYQNFFLKLGDPYAVNIPTSMINKNANINIVRMNTGLEPNQNSEGSIDNSILVTLIKKLEAYSAISNDAEGCDWTIEFFDGSTENDLPIPDSYNLGEKCYFGGAKHSECGDGYCNSSLAPLTNDSLKIAAFNLLNSLDFNDDRLVDVKFTQDNFQISSTRLEGIPYEWSTEVQIRRWD